MFRRNVRVWRNEKSRRRIREIQISMNGSIPTTAPEVGVASAIPARVISEGQKVPPGGAGSLQGMDADREVKVETVVIKPVMFPVYTGAATFTASGAPCGDSGDEAAAVVSSRP